MIQNHDIINKCRGALVGGAVGDALGYEVEFMGLRQIHRRFGTNGISEFVLDGNGVAVFSDDTQMTLFTAEGLLAAVDDGKSSAEDILPYIRKAYFNWYITQTQKPMKLDGSHLADISSLWSRRAPGMTCLSALKSLYDGCAVKNYSKGCGGVMRVAPVGIFSAAHLDQLNIWQAGILAGEAAHITHKHPLSTYSSMALAMVVAECIPCGEIDRELFGSIVMDMVFNKLDLLFKDDKNLIYLYELVCKALSLAVSDKTDTDAISALGEGWVGEETLAIALFSAMRYIDDFEKCVVCSVNHNGDSDSTGAVAGNIIGAILGYNSIPAKYKTGLELHDILLSIADALAEPR